MDTVNPKTYVDKIAKALVNIKKNPDINDSTRELIDYLLSDKEGDSIISMFKVMTRILAVNPPLLEKMILAIVNMMVEMASQVDDEES